MTFCRAWMLIIFIAGCGSGSSPAIVTCDVTVSWVPPTERVDGSPLEKVISYRIYIENIRIEEVAGDLISWEVRNLPTGRLVISMTATGQYGLESDRSETIVRFC